MTNQPLSEKIEEIIKRLKAIKPENNEQYNKIALQLLLIEEIIDIQKQAIQKTLKELKEDINNGCGDEFLSDDGDFELMCGRNKQLCEHCQAQLEFIDITFKKHFGGLAE